VPITETLTRQYSFKQGSLSVESDAFTERPTRLRLSLQRNLGQDLRFEGELVDFLRVADAMTIIASELREHGLAD
jgi:hypothetical protein